MKLDTNVPMVIGMLGELSVRKELHKQGYNVYVPICDTSQVDLIVEQDNGTFSKVNVKTVSKFTTRTSIQINCRKHVNTDRVDCIAVYWPPDDIVAFVPYTNQERITLALKTAKNNQKQGRNWFWSYTDFPEFE